MTTNRTTMRAVVLDAPGPPDALQVREIPVPTPRPGEVLIKVEAFGLGGMGRTFNGGYAEYTCVPVRQVVPFANRLDWAALGAVPEMLQTSHGSLTIGLDAQPGQSILIRGGTSSIDMATTVLAKRLGMTVLSTTRQPERTAVLKCIGVDHVLVDDSSIAAQAREVFPDGVDAALELIGTPTLP